MKRSSFIKNIFLATGIYLLPKVLRPDEEVELDNKVDFRGYPLTTDDCYDGTRMSRWFVFDEAGQWPTCFRERNRRLSEQVIKGGNYKQPPLSEYLNLINNTTTNEQRNMDFSI